MCGFLAIIGHGRTAHDLESLLARAQHTLAHRGPDQAGMWHDADVALAATRLAIRGGAASDQPCVSGDGQVVLVFNGEIAADRMAGSPHRDAGDTRWLAETLAERLARAPEAMEAHHAWLGDMLVGGMGAVVAWHRASRRVLVAADPLGIKPLHYRRLPGGAHAYGSTVAVLRELQPVCDLARASGLAALAGDHVSGGGLLEGIHEATRSVGVAGRDPETGRTDAARFAAWLGADGPGPRIGPSHLKKAWQHSARLAAEADVPTGVFLSGGLDSAATAAWCGRRDIVAYTGRFAPVGGPFDESRAAADVAAAVGLEHRVVDISDQDLVESLPQVMRHLEAPMGGPGSLSLYLLGRSAAADGIKVILTGTGGDELLAGYTRIALALGRAGPWTVGYESLQARVADLAPEDPRRVARLYTRGDVFAGRLRPEFAALLRAHAEEIEPMADGASADDQLRACLARERKTLRMLLRVEDRMLMAHGIEGRPVPSMGRVALAAARLGVDELVGPDGEGKRVLRSILAGAIPETVRRDRQKRGFPTPFARAARGAGRAFVEDVLADRRFRERGWWDVDACRALLDEDVAAWDRSLFAVLSWELWARHHLDGVPREEVRSA